LSGIADRNRPWLSERLREIGVDATQIQIVGDRAKDMLAALQFMADHRPGRRGGGGADVPPAGDSVGDIDTFKSVVSNPRTGKRVGLTETSCAIFDIAKPGSHGPRARHDVPLLEHHLPAPRAAHGVRLGRVRSSGPRPCQATDARSWRPPQ